MYKSILQIEFKKILHVESILMSHFLDKAQVPLFWGKNGKIHNFLVRLALKKSIHLFPLQNYNYPPPFHYKTTVNHCMIKTELQLLNHRLY